MPSVNFIIDFKLCNFQSTFLAESLHFRSMWTKPSRLLAFICTYAHHAIETELRDSSI